MAWLILLGIVALPVIEIALFVKSAEAIGVLATVAVAFLAVSAGITILRLQGLAILWRARAQLARGEAPLDEAFDGLCLAAAGFLLVLPGFLTDAMAILLLLPPVRGLLKLWLGRHFRAVTVAAPPRPPGGGGGVIETDYKVIDGDRHQR